MDLNYSLGPNDNVPCKFNLLPQSPGVNGTQPWIGNYPSPQQPQQSNAQIGMLNLTDTGTNYLDALLAISQGGIGSPQSSPLQNPFLVSSVQPSFYNLSTLSPLLPNSFAYAPMMSQEQFNQTMGVPTSPIEVPESLRSSGDQTETPFSSQGTLQMSASQIPPTLIGSYGGIPENRGANSEQQNSESNSQSRVDIVSHPRQRAALETLYVGNTPPKSSTRLLLSPKRLIDGNTSSTTQIPGSPVSMEYSITFSDSGSSSSEARSPLSPTSPRFPFMNGDISRSALSPTFYYKQKYPQDQCFRCSKKVYPMEKLGPVKGVMYHKGCFQCRICHTRLNLKNFFHNQNDLEDLQAYCKSHQPEAVGKAGKIDSDTILIKGAINAPKLNKINEQIRGDGKTGKGGRMDLEAMEIKSALHAPKPQLAANDQVKSSEHSYNIGTDSMQIVHATHVPARELQTGVKVQNQAWNKEDRTHKRMPPPDVVRHDDPVPDYDLSELKRIPVEFYPEYEYDVATDTYIFHREFQ